MPPALSPIQTATGEFLLLEALLPGRPPETIGVLLLDPQNDQLYVRLRRDFLEFANEDQYEVLRELADDIQRTAEKLGARALLADFEDKLSNTFRVSGRESVLVHNYRRTLNDLYQHHVPARPLRFETHLPYYAVVPAAGGFGREADTDEVELLEMPEDLSLTEQMFVVKVSGHSMEPLIQDGQLCVFRRGVVGSRNGRRILAEEAGSRYTVKVYRSQKRVTEEGYQHERIWLEPLNPAYPNIELDESSEVKIFAEFVRALDEF